MVFHHSMNADSVVGIPKGGSDTQTLPYAKEFIELFEVTGGQDKNFRREHSCHCLCLSHLVKLSLDSNYFLFIL